MSDDLTIGIRLTADGSAMVGTVKIGREEIDKLAEATRRAGGETDSFSAKQAGLSSQLRSVAGEIAAYWAAWQFGEKIKEMALLNARHETLGVVMGIVGRNAGYTSAEIEKYAQGVQKMGITMIESRQSVIDLAQSQIDLSMASKLARVAQDAAVIGGLNSSEALNRLVYGIKSAQVDVLRTIGLNVNFEESYKKLAHQMHKSSESLSEAEKSQARTNAVMEAGTLIAGSYEAAMGTAGKQIASMVRYTEDLKVKQGEVFNEALTIGVMAFTEHLKESNAQLDEMSKNKQIDEWGRDLTDVVVFLANEMDNLYTANAMVIKTIVAGAVQLKELATGNLSGVKAVGAAWMDDMDKMAQGYDRLDRAAKQFRTQRESDARSVYGKDGKVSMQFATSEDKKAWTEQEESIALMLNPRKPAAATQDKSLEDKFKSAMSSLGAESAKLSAETTSILKYGKAVDEAKEAVIRFQTAKGNLKDLNAGQKRQLISAAHLVDERAATKKFIEDQEKDVKELEKAYSADVKKTEEYVQSMQDANAMRALENSLIGKTSSEQRVILEQARIDIDLKKQNKDLSSNLIEVNTAAAESAKQSIAASVEASRTFGAGMSTALADYNEEVSNTGRQTRQAFSNGFNSAENALLKFSMHGESALKNLGNVASAVADDIARAFIRKNITAPLYNSMFGGGSWLSTASGAQYGTTPFSEQSMMLAGQWHTSGGTGDTPAVTRSLPASVFASAPRFHSGIGPGERAAVIRDDESVLTPGQMRQLAPVQSGRGGVSNVVINIIESPGKGGQQQQRSDGGIKIIDVFVEQVKSAIASDISRGSGAVPAALAGTYGLNRSAGSY